MLDGQLKLFKMSAFSNWWHLWYTSVHSRKMAQANEYLDDGRLNTIYVKCNASSSWAQRQAIILQLRHGCGHENLFSGETVINGVIRTKTLARLQWQWRGDCLCGHCDSTLRWFSSEKQLQSLLWNHLGSWMDSDSLYDFFSCAEFSAYCIGCRKL